jgi:hypothetical protein
MKCVSLFSATLLEVFLFFFATVNILGVQLEIRTRGQVSLHIKN